MPQHVAVADLDGDTFLDLVVSFRADGTTDISGGTSILRGKGNGQFFPALTSTGHTSPTAAGIADFNGDARPDLALANFFSGDVSVLINNMVSPTGSVAGLVFNDADADGLKDAGEAAISNWRVFIDADNDGQYDTGEALGAHRRQRELRAGQHPRRTYSLRQVLQSGWALGRATAGTYTVNLAPGQALSRPGLCRPQDHVQRRGRRSDELLRSAQHRRRRDRGLPEYAHHVVPDPAPADSRWRARFP
jgi:hypothetical protein